MNNKKESGDEDNYNLESLKSSYDKFMVRYSLPEFYELNKMFDIEEINKDTDFLLRKIRRVISERISAYSRFVEIILNPSNAPVFFFNLLKKLDSQDIEEIKEVYSILGNLELEMLSMDLEYSESKEADFIKKIVNIFEDKIKPSLIKIIGQLENKDTLDKKDNRKSYFG